jgi:hypothetical protein
MTIKIVDRTDGDTLRAGPMSIRVLEDGRDTEHRLGIVEVTIPPRLDGPPSTCTVSTMRPSMSCRGAPRS